MEKQLKIQDLEVGKIYRAFYKGVEQKGGVYKIESGKKLFVNHHGWKGSGLLYNEMFDVIFEEIKREINWTKVPRGTKVQVRDEEDREWKNRYFVEICKRNPIFIFKTSVCLNDDFTGYEMEDYCNRWKYCRIHPSVEIPDEWYKEVR